MQGRSRGDLCMKSNKRREAEIDRLAKIEAESGKKKSKNGKKGPAGEHPSCTYCGLGAQGIPYRIHIVHKNDIIYVCGTLSSNDVKRASDESADAPTPGPLVSRHRVLLLKPSPKAPSQEGQPQDKVEGTAGWQTVLAEELTGSGGEFVARVP